MTPIGETAESILRNTARALVEVSKAQDKKRRRPVMTWEVREIARLYAEEKISIDEMVVRLQRPRLTIYRYLRTLNIQRRRPHICGVQWALQRRDAKIVEAIASGDNPQTVARRWQVSERRVNEIVEDHRRNFFRENVRFKLTASATMGIVSVKK